MSDVADQPEFLYHYTTPSGLLGILRSGCIYATDPRFMNDSAEQIGGWDAIWLAAADQATGDPAVTDRHWRRDWAPFPTAWFSTFVASFTSRADDLGQWRGYGNGGFALVFDRASLGAVVAAHGRLTPIHYMTGARDLPVEIVEAARELGSPFRDAGATDQARLQRLGGQCVYLARHGGHQRIADLALGLKSAAFRDESEWRAILFGDGLMGPGYVRPSGLGVKVREGAYGLSPFVELRLFQAGAQGPLRAVVVGPGRHQELNAIGVQKALAGQKLTSVTVEKSALTYRPT